MFKKIRLYSKKNHIKKRKIITTIFKKLKTNVCSLFEQFFGIMPNSEEIFISSHQFSSCVGRDICVHIVVSQP